MSKRVLHFQNSYELKFWGITVCENTYELRAYAIKMDRLYSVWRYTDNSIATLTYTLKISKVGSIVIMYFTLIRVFWSELILSLKKIIMLWSFNLRRLVRKALVKLKLLLGKTDLVAFASWSIQYPQWMQNNLNVYLLVFVIWLQTVNIYMCQEKAGIWQSYSSLYFFLISIVFDLICEVQLKHCNTFSTIMYIIARISIKSSKVYFFNTNVNKKSKSKTNMNLGIFYYKPLTLRHPCNVIVI